MTNSPSLQNKTFLLLLVLVTLGFLSILWPLFGAVFWAMALAILFMPLHRRILAKMPRSPNLAALSTLSLCLVVVIFPLVLLSISLLQETATLYAKVQSGQINFGNYFQQIMNAMPQWASSLLDRLHLTTVDSLQEKLSSVAAQATQFVAGQALSLGQDTLSFLLSFGIMLYLLYFLLRDGQQLAQLIRNAVPLDKEHKKKLGQKFTTVIRATVKGNVVVAASQGALGGLIFWILGIQAPVLWGVLMAFLSLLPAVGASLIWMPVAIYFLATGEVGKGTILILFGVLVIGLVDNILRPLLVGKDTKMPDYIVLISTLGGMSMFGITGFVIGPVIAALFMSVWALFAPDAARDAGIGDMGSPAEPPNTVHPVALPAAARQAALPPASDEGRSQPPKISLD